MLECRSSSSVLVIAPAYPTVENPYLCAFVHARVIAYQRAGFNVQVAVLGDDRYDERLPYKYEDVPCIPMGAGRLRRHLLEAPPYGVIVAHFVSLPLLRILEHESARSRILVIFHGAELLGAWFEAFPGRKYFTPPGDFDALSLKWSEHRRTLRRLVSNAAFSWVFVSPYLQTLAEEKVGIRFDRQTYVIPNAADERRFVKQRKCPEARKKIFFCRRFDNECVYSIDVVVLAIRRLSKKPYFGDLSFEIYGDGNDYDRLVSPIRGFPNVHLHRFFVPNSELPRLYAGCGIGLYPSRYDSQPVAITEAALSGMVVIGGDLPINRLAFPPEIYGTLVDPDSPDDIVAQIERFYYNPEEFLRIAETMGDVVRTLFSRENTILKEIQLLQQLCVQSTNNSVCCASAAELARERMLCVIVPAYNVASYLPYCLGSLLSHGRVDRMEIVVVDDGSSDATLEVAKTYERRFPDTVRVISKANGGHGSCINAALPLATARYVRVVDADDWVVSSALESLLERLEHQYADCVLTMGCFDYVDTASTAEIIRYDNMPEAHVRNFDDLCFEGFGFKGYGPILSTANWKRTCLLASQVHIDEGRSYTDMEWNVYPLRSAETLVWLDLDIYRYTQGRPGQSVSREALVAHWRDHDYVFWQIVAFWSDVSQLSEAKRTYILQNILAEYGCNHIFALYLAQGMSAVKRFISELTPHPALKSAVLDFVMRQNGDSKAIVVTGKVGGITASRKLAETSAVYGVYIFWQVRTALERLGFGARGRAFLKGCLPYALVRMWQSRIYGLR